MTFTFSDGLFSNGKNILIALYSTKQHYRNIHPKFKNMKLTDKQIFELWGQTGPYSEAEIVIQHRILDDRVSRIFIEVQAKINPTTFKVVKANQAHFSEDIMMQQLLDHAKDMGRDLGYLVNAFTAEYRDESVMREAERRLEYVKETLIKMHQYTMELLDLKK